MRRIAAVWWLLWSSLACARTPPVDGALHHPAPARIVAIGDLHGDVAAARTVLRLAGAIDAGDHWIGKDLVVVQLGDEIDRNDDDAQILELFDRLVPEAAKAGGAVIPLLGNHELMNAAGDFRYVTPGGFAAFGGQDGRRAAFAPGGPVALRLARRSLYVILGDTAFVHGGILPAHVDAGLETLDAEARAWLRGEHPSPPEALVDRESPLWTRRYGGTPGPEDCAALTTVLDRLHLRRMIVAHTTQEHIDATCDGRVWRIDVGLAREYGGPREVLEIAGDKVRILHP